MLEAQNTLAGQLRWLAAVRGIVAILAGIVVFIWPGISLIALVYLFGIYAFMNGILAIVVAFQVRSTTSSWWALLIEGLVGIATGCLTFFWPGITVLVLLMLIAFWAVLLGIFEIAAAFVSHDTMGERWMMGIAGALSLLFGVLMFRHPGAGLLTVIWLIGFYAIIWGITLIACAVQQHGPAPLSHMEHERYKL
jgi:uncharacterized membrane protein HdeD (DUF308 family)